MLDYRGSLAKHVESLGPPTDYDDDGSRCVDALEGPAKDRQREKKLQTDCGDPDLRDSRLWAHNLSTRMGLEVRGAMMNTPQQKDIPNV